MNEGIEWINCGVFISQWHGCQLRKTRCKRILAASLDCIPGRGNGRTSECSCLACRVAAHCRVTTGVRGLRWVAHAGGVTLTGDVAAIDAA